MKDVWSVRLRPSSRSAMQAGRGGAAWIIEYMPPIRSSLDPLTGWSRSVDPRRQIERRFDSLVDAIMYAEAHGMSFEVDQVASRKAIQPKIYADNFRTNRHENWTH